jgi:hypothetical protein
MPSRCREPLAVTGATGHVRLWRGCRKRARLPCGQTMWRGPLQRSQARLDCRQPTTVVIGGSADAARLGSTGCFDARSRGRRLRVATLSKLRRQLAGCDAPLTAVDRLESEPRLPLAGASTHPSQNGCLLCDDPPLPGRTRTSGAPPQQTLPAVGTWDATAAQIGRATFN